MDLNMDDIETECFGTLHKSTSLPPIPPSFDESILYGQSIQFYLRLPKDINKGKNSSNKFWKGLQRKNLFPPKITTRMLCVLITNKKERYD